jgi:hypothetical protein
MTKSKVTHRKKYTIEALWFEDGTYTIKRSNNGFSVMELLGIVSTVKQDLTDLFYDTFGAHSRQPDNVERNASRSYMIQKPETK